MFVTKLTNVIQLAHILRADGLVSVNPSLIPELQSLPKPEEETVSVIAVLSTHFLHSILKTVTYIEDTYNFSKFKKYANYGEISAWIKIGENFQKRYFIKDAQRRKF